MYKRQGLDGGATAYDNVPEKKYNLELAQKLKAFFEAAGYETAMTREDDGDTDGVEGFHKMKDLLNRIELTKKYADCI